MREQVTAPCLPGRPGESTMIRTIRSKDRYHAETDWLSTNWHFSFDHYHDPENMNFGPLRVFNDDTVAPAGGFPFHGHREMEIVTYMIDGALEHKDNVGNTGVIRPGEIQRMSAGTGIRHSEYNASQKQPAHLLQIWIVPSVRNLQPSYEQKSFSLADREGKLVAIAVPLGKNGNGNSHAVQIHQDATIYTSLLAPGESVAHKLAPGRRAYIFVIQGNLQLNGETLNAGDQARVTSESQLRLSALPDRGAPPTDFLLLDLP
jgi:redox-sensitive bicupin YhaK (pirin superfamily)